MRAGIITFHRAYNFGAVLQAYALEKYINENICEAELIDYIPNNAVTVKHGLLYESLRSIKRILTYRKNKELRVKQAKFDSFMEKYSVSSNKYNGDRTIKNNPPVYDLLISGGDQILNCTLSGNSKAYYLHFSDTIPKISYASSFGRTQITDFEKEMIHTYLPKFRSIAVREDSGAQIIKEITGKDSTVVCDPVFLLGSSEWDSFAADKAKEPYIFVYAMEASDQLIHAVKNVQKMLGLKVITVKGGRFDESFGGEVDGVCGPNDFLGYIKNAEAVITNSFHGLAFSMIFGKKIYAVSHSLRNTRLQNILNISGYGKCMITEPLTDYSGLCVDGSKAYFDLQPMINRSKKYLVDSVHPDRS